MKNLALLSTLILAGCFRPVPGLPPPDASTPDASTPDASTPVTDGGTGIFCDDYATLWCEQSVRCGATMGFFMDRCLVDAKSRCTSASREKAYQTPDPVMAQACLTGLTGACRREGVTFDCDHVFQGRVPEYGACLVPEDCADPKQSCAGTGCAKTCIRAGQLGDPCLQGQTCDHPFVCDAKTITCTRRDPPGQLGQPCGNFYPTQCEPNATCDYQTDTCVALPVAGQKCSFSVERCASSAICRGDMCQARVDVGIACASTDDCLTGLFCEGTCKWRQSGGTACQKNEQCTQGLACVQAKCAVPLFQGEACTQTSECDVGLSCDTLTRVCSVYSFQTKVGASCTGDRTICLSPLRCGSGACALPPACPCSPTQACVRSQAGSFICMDLLPENAQCNDASQCQPPFTCLAAKGGGLRCVKAPGLGDACQITKANPGSCLFPMQCDSTSCVEAGAPGESCLLGAHCISGGCDPTTWQCGAGLAEGATCNASSDCASNTCLRRKCTATCGG